MLRGKKWLKAHKATVKDPSKAYKQAKYAVLLLADMGNETIAQCNFWGNRRSHRRRVSPVMASPLRPKACCGEARDLYVEPPVAEAVLLDWGYAQGLLIEMCYRISDAEPPPVYRVAMTEDETIFVPHPANGGNG